MSTAPTLPAPQSNQAGRNLRELTGISAFITRAALWRPKGAYKEVTASTAARIALMLVDRLTGIAYSADQCRPVAGTPVHGVAATITINPTGTDNSILYTADTVGAAGNDISVQYAISGVGSTVLSVAVDAGAILVTAGSACTAASVITAVNGSASAAALVTAAASGTVTGTIDTVAETSLTGGVDATAATAGNEMFDADYRYLALADVAITSTSGWKKTALATL